jgi:hypothetical protein
MAGEGTALHYRIFGKRVASSLALGALPTIQSGTTAFSLSEGSCLLPREKPSWFHSVGAGGRRRSISFARVAGGFLIRFHGQVDFLVPVTGKAIRFRAQGTLSDEKIAALFLGHVLPLAINLGGREVLHASAICRSGQAIAFAAKSGTGKSSLATALVQNGFPLVSDDALLLSVRGDRIYAQPSMPELRLWRGSAVRFFKDHPGTPSTLKTRIAMGAQFRSAPLPLGRIYFLDPKPGRRGISCRRLAQGEAVPRLLEHSFRLDLLDPNRMEREIALFAKLIGSVPCFRLTYGKRWDVLPRLVEWIASGREA